MEKNNNHNSEFIDEIDRILELVTSKDIEEICNKYHCHSLFIGNSSVENKRMTEHRVLTEGNDYLEDPNALFCLSSKIFASREELQESIRNVALEQGYVTVVRRSKPKYYVIIGCDRGGTYRSTQGSEEQRKRLSTGTRLINCPFEIWGKKKDDIWKLEIKNLSHNHEPSSHLSGHPMCRRFSNNDMHLIRTMTMAGSTPREILTSLRQSNPKLLAISRTMYNARSKIKREELKGRTVVEALVEELGQGGFIYDVELDDRNHLTHLFFSHPCSMSLTNNFPNVFIMDCTYKTNKYNMPILDVIGISSFNTSFYSCIVFMQKEEEEDYIWALERFKKILGVDEGPKVIITDRELALMNAIYKVFPGTTHLLCIWHIEKNILSKCKKLFDKKEDFDMFMSRWTDIVYSLDDSSFDDGWRLFENEYKGKQEAVDYIKNSWLPYKENFVAAWTEQYLHFGNHATSRAEGAHAILKKYLQVSTGNVRDVKEKICLAIENQFKEIRVLLQTEKIRVPHCFHISLFENLLGNVSRHALKQLLKQYELAISGKLSLKCRGHFQSTMGIPCAHQIRGMLNGMLELVDIHPQWRIDERSFVSTREELNCKDDHDDRFLKDFESKYRNMPLTQKEDTQRQISQIVDAPLASMIREPKWHLCKGWPLGSKKRKNDSSTQRDPSEFEIVEKSRKCSRCKGLGHNARTCTRKAEKDAFCSTGGQEEITGAMDCFDL